MRGFLVVFLFLVASCASGGRATTMESVLDVPIGASKDEMVEMLGDPVSEKKLPDGSKEYVYVERFKEGSRNINLRRYYIVIKDGKVVSKRVDQKSPMPTQRNSYDMQTTQNSEPNFN